MATRRAFSADDDGIASAIPHNRVRGACFATGCQMPGTIFASGSESSGTCAWHYDVLPEDIGRVTRVLTDWACVSDEITAGRRVLSGPSASDGAVVKEKFKAAWRRMEPACGKWASELRPGRIVSSAGKESPYNEDYGDWVRRLERFLGARVVEARSLHRSAA